MTAPLLKVAVQGQGSIDADQLNTYQQTCNIMTDLRAFPGAPGVQVFVRGTSAVNDGGQGGFYWNAGAISPVDDNGLTTVVPTGAATGCWSRITVPSSGLFVSTITLQNVAINEAFATLASATTTAIGAAPANYVQITGVTTINAFDTVQAGTRRILVFAGILQLTNSANLILLGGANQTTAVGDVTMFMSEGTGVWRQAFYSRAVGSKPPTRTVLTSGTGLTYTTPAGATRLSVRMVGGGGSGSVGGSPTAAGANGGATTFGASLTANGGTGGAVPGVNAPAPATATGGDFNIPGGQGVPGLAASTTANGGNGAASYFGGEGAGGFGAPGAGAGQAGTTNSGAGGGGGGSTTGANPGAGGNAGAYLEKLITSPAATYTYTVGAGGGAQSGNASCAGSGAGASGIIIIEEIYY